MHTLFPLLSRCDHTALRAARPILSLFGISGCNSFFVRRSCLDIKGHVSDVSPHFQLSSRLGTSTLCHEVPEFSLFRRVSSGRCDIPGSQGYLHVLPVSILTP